MRGVPQPLRKYLPEATGGVFWRLIRRTPAQRGEGVLEGHVRPFVASTGSYPSRVAGAWINGDAGHLKA